jgi:hypothetical protein
MSSATRGGVGISVGRSLRRLSSHLPNTTAGVNELSARMLPWRVAAVAVAHRVGGGDQRAAVSGVQLAARRRSQDRRLRKRFGYPFASTISSQ